MSDTLLLSNLTGRAQRGERRRRDVLHLEAGKEPAEVERGIGEAICDEPSAHSAYHLEVIVDLGYDQIGDLDPHACITHSQDSVEHSREMATADPLVYLVAERLEVNVGSIEVGQQVGKGLSTDVSSCHKDIIETCLVGLASCISDVFDISERLGIGIGDAGAAMLLTKGHEIFGRKIVVRNFARSDLRDIVVLTVQATEVATRAGDRQALGARMEMIKRLLLDRVNSK